MQPVASPKTSYTDETHEPGLESWVDSANARDTDFPIQNLPFGVFRTRGDDRPRIGVAIGDRILDLRGCVETGLLDDLGSRTGRELTHPTLNQFLGRGRSEWRRTRGHLSRLLAADVGTLRDDAPRRERVLVAQADAELVMPVTIGDYTDFYCSIHHATNVGSMFRPDNPLLPNYRHLPIGYHGRASSIILSGVPVRRPCGQTKADDADAPSYGPCRLLDYEAELGFFVGPGNDRGGSIAMADAAEHVFGFCIVNDWSARDVQKWEYQPLGPFNAKNFATTISPWIVTLEALGPFRAAGPERRPDDPPVLEYLQPRDDFGLDINIEVAIRSATMRSERRPPHRVSFGNTRDLYWTVAQMLVHHTSTGCNVRAGDLIASGTVSGETPESRGCLLERTWRGQEPIELPDGTTRTFLQDGDEVTMTAWCEGHGARRIGLGECRAVVQPADVVRREG